MWGCSALVLLTPMIGIAQSGLDGVVVDGLGRGIAGALVTVLIQRLAEQHGARPKACATVVGGNAASRRALHNLGFEPLLELVSYRLRAQRLVA